MRPFRQIGNTIHFPAPAKLNIRLKVIGRRTDGYHELSGIMVPVGCFDELRLTRTQESGIRLECRGRPVPEGRDNLVYRAAEAFFSRIGCKGAVSIRLTKTIPAAAGLGGGSSDAAGTLMALNRLWLDPFSPGELEKLAVGLGADIPFFLRGRPCVAGGIGEILEPIDNWPKYWYLIVTPPIHVSTAWVFGNLKFPLTRHENNYTNKWFGIPPFHPADLMENDLESVTASRFPVIRTIKKSMLDAGAVGALMSGSGPSVFGVFESKLGALRAEERLAPGKPGEFFVAEGIS